MRVGLIDVDSKSPNLALMKLSAWHLFQNDQVEWHSPLAYYDTVYASKVFSFTPNYGYTPTNTKCGGTGYNFEVQLPDCIEHICPDYKLYGISYSMGFLTRGCPNKCEWCVVPKKEGAIREHADVSEFLQHKDVVLLDNNVLGHAHGIEQIEKLATLRVRVDFNQGLDARRIDTAIAKRLAALKWMKPLRLACDSQSSKPYIERAVRLLREAGCNPKNYFCYMLVKDVNEALDRSEFLRALQVDPFAQPYLDWRTNQKPTQLQKDFARWVNHKAIWKTVKWEEYKR